MYYDSILDGVSLLYFDSELKIYGGFFFFLCPRHVYRSGWTVLSLAFSPDELWGESARPNLCTSNKPKTQK